MKFGVLGTGVVGESIATALVKKGHEVIMGSRKAGNEKASEWTRKMGPGATEGDFNTACRDASVIFICLNGEHVIDVIESIDTDYLTNKIMIDVTNPLDFSNGLPPRILQEFEKISLGESIQNLLPDTFIVKALNTINYKLMVDARIVNDARHNLFICGNSKQAKNEVKHLLAHNFHWLPEMIIDLGDISHARATEGIVPFWVLVWEALDTPLFNFKIVQ